MASDHPMRYSEYKTSDFLKDDYFVRWVTKGDNGSDHFWEKWLKNHPEKSEEVAEARRIIQALRYKKRHTLKEDTYTELLEGILRDKTTKRNAIRIEPRSRRKFSWVAVAASVAVMAITFYLTISNNESIEPEVFSMVTKETSKGQRTTLRLSDGSTIKLNHLSTLQFPEEFSDSSRTVFLEGEAFFEVSRDEHRSFTVVSNNISTTALGTSFNVNSNRIANNVKVALVTGKVRVEDTSGSIVILEPNELVNYNQGKISKEVYDYDQEIAWKDGKLYFNQDKLVDVFEQLENWYGVEFEFNTELKGDYTGEFSNNPPLPQVLDGISFATGLNFTNKSNQIIIVEQNEKE